MSAQFDRLLPALVRGDVQFILVGGVAGIVHGAARLTYDVDVVYDRSVAVSFKCVYLATLIELKRAAGRPKDLESLAELERLLEEGEQE